MKRQRDDNHDHHRERYSQQTESAKFRDDVGHVHGARVGEPQTKPTSYEQHGQRRNESDDSQSCDEKRIDRACCDTHSDSRRER